MFTTAYTLCSSTNCYVIIDNYGFFITVKTIKIEYSEKTIFLFPFKLNGIRSWWQCSFRFEPNRIPFGSKSKGKPSPRSYPIQCERKWEYSFLSVEWKICYIQNRLYVEFSTICCMSCRLSNLFFHDKRTSNVNQHTWVGITYFLSR